MYITIQGSYIPCKHACTKRLCGCSITSKQRYRAATYLASILVRKALCSCSSPPFIHTQRGQLATEHAAKILCQDWPQHVAGIGPVVWVMLAGPGLPLRHGQQTSKEFLSLQQQINHMCSAGALLGVAEWAKAAAATSWSNTNTHLLYLASRLCHAGWPKTVTQTRTAAQQRTP